YIGHILSDRQELQEAEESFRRAVNHHDQCFTKLGAHPEFNRERAAAYSALGNQLLANARAQAQDPKTKLQEAAANFSKYIEIDSKEPSVWNNRGEVFAELEKWDQADADFAKAVELAPQQPLQHFHLALARL